MSDKDKRIGRQSAENTKQTRKDIIDAATQLFCQQGYANVSLRAISEQAGVSHGLIRHHFGTKFQVWQQVCDRIEAYFHQFVSSLTQEFSPELASNERLFYVIINLQAVLMLDPRPIQLMADSMGQDAQMHDYIFEDDDELARLIAQMLEQCHQEGIARQLALKELEWLCCSSANSFVSLAPLAKNTYPGVSFQQVQVNHWRLFARSICGLLALDFKMIPEIDSLASFVAKSQFITDFGDNFDCENV
ncbi:TetR/AcrR family transcriptional regulator [Shewanella sp. SR44-3]|uniref:TetR/AcrR family transcriptional regulator n=1 Tax=unclassified Shewanella TaxID=196818 RepID=UPI0015FD6AA0|nr:TetR/AcrR family transcriptional regulator [Shewanella sp. SR44-3]MBB1270563.1 TetR/AcrR family transcriptional regulator [Shewanella sp. SR44-3]